MIPAGDHRLVAVFLRAGAASRLAGEEAARRADLQHRGRRGGIVYYRQIEVEVTRRRGEVVGGEEIVLGVQVDEGGRR